MTDTNDKVRSLILAALMVFSVFAGTVALSGTAVAEHANTQDDSLGDDRTYWQGQQLGYDGSASNDADTDGTYQVRHVDDGGLATEVTTDDDGHVLVDSSKLDAGIYNLTDGEGNVVVANFEIVEQDFEASFDPDSVENNDNSSLELDSNRGSFNITVSATHEGDDVSEDVLGQIFNESGADAGAENDDGVVVVPATGSASIEGNFTGVDAGNYTFSVSAEDTTASDTANVSVTDAADGDVEFSQSTFEVAQGDIGEITVEFEGDTTQGTVVVGEQSESGYQANITVTDGNEDGEVTILFNTYNAGMSGTVVEAAAEDDDANLEGEGSLSNILEQGDYGIAVTLGHETDGSETLSSPDDVGTLYINERSTDSASTWTAPGSVSDVTDAELTEDSSIAQDDWVVVEFSATGLSGLVNDDLSAANGDGLNLTVEQTEESTPQNTPPKELNFADDGVELWSDGANGTYYVAIDTSDEDVLDGDAFEAGDEYDATLTVDDEQLIGDEEESVSASFEISEGEISIDEPVEVTAEENQSITGSSTYAPGTEFQVQIESTGDTQPRFFESETAVVQDDGSWSVTFDRFSEQSAGDTFDVVADGGDPVDGNVVENVTTTGNETTGTTETTEVTTSVTDTTEDPGTDETTEDPGETTEDPGETTEDPGEETTETDTPGFGVVVALVALVAAALLAVRRD